MNKVDLKNIRKCSGLSQEEISKLLGIKQQQYSRYENNKNKISLETFLKILDVCKIEVKLKRK